MEKTPKSQPGYKKKLGLIAREDIGTVRRDEPLRLHSRWRIGGPADLLVEPENRGQISRVLRLSKSEGVPILVVGNGTNLLFDDLGVRGLVLKIGRRFSRYRIQDNRISVEAGIWTPKLARVSACAGLTGLEHTIGIPGTVGGLVWMNGGSQRRSIGTNVRSVTILDEGGQLHVLPPAVCGFEYRRSAFQEMKAVIVGVAIECALGDPRRIKSEMLQILRGRRRKFPLKLPNCGSVFVSGRELYERFGPPGRIIEELGLKGLRIGDAEVSPLHANFFVNRGRASSADILALIHRVRDAVQAHTGVWMEAEVRYVAPDATVVVAHHAI